MTPVARELQQARRPTHRGCRRRACGALKWDWTKQLRSNSTQGLLAFPSREGRSVQDLHSADHPGSSAQAPSRCAPGPPRLACRIARVLGSNCLVAKSGLTPLIQSSLSLEQSLSRSRDRELAGRRPRDAPDRPPPWTSLSTKKVRQAGGCYTEQLRLFGVPWPWSDCPGPFGGRRGFRAAGMPSAALYTGTTCQAWCLRLRACVCMFVCVCLNALVVHRLAVRGTSRTLQQDEEEQAVSTAQQWLEEPLIVVR